jgi:methionyl-tRNA synthetase
MLMAHENFNLPYDVPANEYLTLSGEQFSKSRGIGEWLPDIIKKFNADAIRYYLSINMPEKRDTDWNWDDFVTKVNNELVAIYGNFIHRVLTFAYKNFGKIPPYTKGEEKDEILLDEIISNFNRVGECIENCNFKEGIKKIIRIAQMGNQYMNACEPWKLVREDIERCQSVIHICTKIVNMLAIASSPYMPKSSNKIWGMLGHENNVEEENWDKFLELPERKIQEPLPIFNKIIFEKKSDDPFAIINLRVAKINSVKDHPNADNLYVLDLDVGKLGKRNIVAGIKRWYNKEELVGKKIIIIINLSKAKIRGVESQGMLLAVDEKGKAVLLIAQAEEGSAVYIDEIKQDPVKEVSFDEFKKIKMMSKNNKVVYKNKVLRDKINEIRTDAVVADGYPVR